MTTIGWIALAALWAVACLFSVLWFRERLSHTETTRLLNVAAHKLLQIAVEDMIARGDTKLAVIPPDFIGSSEDIDIRA